MGAGHGRAEITEDPVIHSKILGRERILLQTFGAIVHRRPGFDRTGRLSVAARRTRTDVGVFGSAAWVA